MLVFGNRTKGLSVSIRIKHLKLKKYVIDTSNMAIFRALLLGIFSLVSFKVRQELLTLVYVCLVSKFFNIYKNENIE